MRSRQRLAHEQAAAGEAQTGMYQQSSDGCVKRTVPCGSSSRCLSALRGLQLVLSMRILSGWVQRHGRWHASSSWCVLLHGAMSAYAHTAGGFVGFHAATGRQAARMHATEAG